MSQTTTRLPMDADLLTMARRQREALGEVEASTDTRANALPALLALLRRVPETQGVGLLYAFAQAVRCDERER